MTKFEILVSFINDKKTVTRKDITKYFGTREMQSQTIDGYRAYLSAAGYLKNIKRGEYKVIKRIPKQLTAWECRREAYGV